MCAPHGHPKWRIWPFQVFFFSPHLVLISGCRGGVPRLILAGFHGNNFPVPGMESTQPRAPSCQDPLGLFLSLFPKKPLQCFREC